MRRTLASMAFALLASAGTAPAADTLLTFDDVTSLSDYAPLGITFSPNASLWSADGVPSVRTDPQGGAYSLPNALTANDPQSADLYFDSDISYFSIYALSGPGPDPLHSASVTAYDANGAIVDTHYGLDFLQFQRLYVIGTGIRHIRLGGLLWDQATFDTAAHLPGDLNEDRVVDLSDLNLALNEFGSYVSDGNIDPGYDLKALNDVLNNFGSSLPAPALSVIPEPSFLLPLSGLSLFLARRRR